MMNMRRSAPAEVALKKAVAKARTAKVDRMNTRSADGLLHWEEWKGNR
jgi:hypothetical protein